MKKIVVLFLILILLIEPVLAAEFVPSSSNLSKKELRKEQMDFLVDNQTGKYVLDLNRGFLLRTFLNNEELGQEFYDNDLNLIFSSNDNLKIKYLDSDTDKFNRFIVLEKINEHKFALYDMKKQKLTEFKYDAVTTTDWGKTPLVYIDGRKYRLQPIKNIFISTVNSNAQELGLIIVYCTLAIPVIILTFPISIPLMYMLIQEG